MPDTISLKAYIGKVEDLLSVAQTDEAIYHCRHILQYFPRYVPAYRLLGRALLHNSRWDEARVVFLRVLAAQPDDFMANVGLSEIYEHKGQGTDAIWHLERAYEQKPTDKALVDRLRDLYKRHRNVDHVRLQLTSAAVARQQAAAGYDERAIDTLRRVLARTPDRYDLLLLLGNTLWTNDQHIEAAETALDLLEMLPDCVDANIILTRLWLSEERPSDAQRYLNHLEALNPYLALELAQGQPPPDEAFSLDELDYRRFAEREMTANRPDWLQGIDSTDVGSIPVNTSVAKPVTGLLKPLPVAEPEEEEWPDLFGEQAETETETQAPRAPTTGDLFGDLPDQWPGTWAATEMPPEQPAVESPQTSAFNQVPTFGGTGKLDWAKLGDSNADAPIVEDPDAMSWLRDSGVTVDEPDGERDPSLQQFFGDDDRMQMEQELADPLSWLQGSGVEVDHNPAPLFVDPYELADQTQITDPAADPLSWLRGSGIEVDESALEQEPTPLEDNHPLTDQPADPLAWLRSSGVEIQDIPEPVEDVIDPDSLPALNDLEWMRDGAPPDGGNAVPLDRATVGEPPSSTDDADFFTWLAEQQKSASVGVGDIAIDDSFDWLNDDALLADLDQDEDRSDDARR